jgi:hypothetical protein
MDPYLEHFWQDLHARLILYSCDQIEEQLPQNLIARVEERVVLEAEDTEDRSIYPDVKIDDVRSGRSAGAAVASRARTTEPIIVRYRSEPAFETFIHVLDPTNRNRLVTVIEILSLAKKLPGEGQRRYRQKQDELRAAQVSLVEIDLLRKGQRVLSLPVTRIPRSVRMVYQACVRRGWNPLDHEIYPIPLRSRLPTIKIPLREHDQEVGLDLQAVLDLAYRKARYQATIDYDQSPEPPLTGDDAKWARTIVKRCRRA